MLLLYAKGHAGQQAEPVRGRTRLMKMVFLFDKEVRGKFNLDKVIPKKALPDFSPYDFGPFSSRVFSDLEFLVELGFVDQRPAGDTEPLLEESIEYEYWQAAGGQSDGRPSLAREEEFALTKLGRQFVEGGRAGVLSDNQWKTLDDFKARCTGTPLRSLLRYVYAKYPQMATASTIRSEILADR